MLDKPLTQLPRIRTRGPLAEKVYTILKEAIISGTIESGMWLQEEALTKALNVSRTPVREAFNRLKSDGFIKIIPRRGARIIELSDQEIDELFEVREKIETIFFDRSAQSISLSAVQHFRQQMKSCDKAMRNSRRYPDEWNKNRRKYLRLDRSMHDSLVKAINNSYWQRIYFDIRDRIEIIGNQLSFDQQWFDVAIADHYVILEAIESGDLEAGRAAMSSHINNVHRGIVRIRSQIKKELPFS